MPASMRTVDEPGAGGVAAKPAERVAIKLPAATLDLYVGTYKIHDYFYLDVKREGDQLSARATGQRWYEIYPEKENYFFLKGVDVQIEFANDGTGNAVMYQMGHRNPLTRADPSESANAQAVLDARIASQAASPGTETALRRTIDAHLKGTVNYGDMEGPLAAVARQQEAGMLQTFKQLGSLQEISFKGVGQMGWDAYDVKFANGTLNCRIVLAPNGKIAGLMMLAAP
jgi:hypothetical protein